MSLVRSFTIPYKKGAVNVLQWGQGEHVVIALHGFGRSAQQFSGLAKTLGPQFTVLAPDLPWHGRTRWARDFYSRKDWIKVVDAISRKVPFTRFHLIGHSLGGRIALRMSPSLNGRLRSLLLIAPDGLGGRYTGWIDYVPSLLRRRMSKWIDRPEGLLRIARMLHRRGWLNRYALEYLNVQLGEATFRRRLRGTWESLPGFRLRRKKIIPALQEVDYPIHVLVGEHDPLLRVRRIQRWFRHLSHAEVNTIGHGHSLPIASCRAFLIEQLMR